MSDTERGSGATAARRARPFAASTLALAFAVALAPATAERAATGTQPAVDGEAERASIETWRAERIRRLTSEDRKSTRLNSSHEWISYAVFCLKKKTRQVRSREL